MIALFNLQGYVLQLLPMAATVTLRAPLRIKYRDIMKLVSRSRYRSARREAIKAHVSPIVTSAQHHGAFAEE